MNSHYVYEFTVCIRIHIMYMNSPYVYEFVYTLVYKFAYLYVYIRIHIICVIVVIVMCMITILNIFSHFLMHVIFFQIFGDIMDQKTHDDILEFVESLKSWDQSLFVDHVVKKLTYLWLDAPMKWQVYVLKFKILT